MLKSITSLALRAQTLIVSYYSWKDGTLEDQLATWNGPKRVGHIRAVQSQATSYRDQARAITADANFAQLDADVQDDMKAIAEELDKAIIDMTSETDPDQKFAKADPTSKHDATAGMRVDDDVVARFKARASGKLRDTVTPPPKPDPNPKK
jgi:uncharacterized protein (DUF4415 family)